jgi:hypothetical protein
MHVQAEVDLVQYEVNLIHDEINLIQDEFSSNESDSEKSVELSNSSTNNTSQDKVEEISNPSLNNSVQLNDEELNYSNSLKDDDIYAEIARRIYFNSFDANFNNFNANPSSDYNTDMDKVIIYDDRGYMFTHNVFDDEFISNLHKLAIEKQFGWKQC